MNAHVAMAIGSNDAGRAKEAVGTPFEELFDGVDDLIRRVADVENPEIRKVRAKVHAALVAAKSALEAKSSLETNSEFEAKSELADDAVQVRGEAVQVAESIDGDLRDYNGQVLGVALLVGLGLGLITSVRQ